MDTSRSNPFIDRLIRLGDISAEEQHAILDACEPPMEVAAGADIVSDGEEPGFSVAMLGGVAFRYKSLPDGRRQIISFQVPGDGIDVYGYALKRLDHGVSALTRCKVVHIPHERLDALITRYPRLTLTLWRQTVMDASLMLEQLVRVGQRPALERVAKPVLRVRSPPGRAWPGAGRGLSPAADAGPLGASRRPLHRARQPRGEAAA